MTMEANAVWLITGCSTGFGRELAKEALHRGWRVALTARNLDQIGDLVDGRGDRALALQLDVTDTAQRKSVFDAVQARWGSVDVLVNNAGVGYFSSVEEADLDAVKPIFETNFFGLAGMIQLALPSMRARKTGWLVNISSISGFAGFAALSFYSASKHAVEGLSQVLRQEVEPLGIRVICVEPGGFRTEFSNRGLNGKMTAFADYEPTVGRVMENVLSKRRDQPGDPVRAAHIIIDAIISDSPPQHLVLGAQCYNAVHRVADQLLQEIEHWREISLAADYPPEPR
jgi:NAD(P)-dependent dehydrogenase (short-subunit alcohol dehydrogenase family)